MKNSVLIGKIMKLLSTIILLLFISLPQLNASSASAIAVAGSYSLRASGSEANYWNPANLTFRSPYQIEVTLINSYLSLNNNAISISKYNALNGTYLTEGDKHKIIDNLQDNFSLQSTVTHYIAGITLNNIAFSSRINLFAKGNLSAKYVELLLLGNEYDRLYSFDQDNNNLEILGYIDFTVGFSPYTIQISGYQIHTGIALSFLTGLGILTTEDYNGLLIANDQGVQLEQDIVMKNGLAGLGFKSLIGFRSDLTDNLTLGLTIDNLGGYIHWTDRTERRYYSTAIDSVYIINLDEDIFVHTETREEIGHFSSTLPLFTRISALYQFQDLNLSLDWKQGFVNSVLTSKTPEIAMGTEYFVMPQIPLRMGFSPGLGSSSYKLSYGIGYSIPAFEINLGVYSVGALIPSSYSRGLATALSSKWRF